jgi:hypothetical protein
VHIIHPGIHRVDQHLPCREFEHFNVQLGGLFDGVDWDLEGNDNRSAPTARFTIETLNVMADFSVCVKKTLGMSVSMAPAESYLDALGPSGARLQRPATLDDAWHEVG